MTRVDREFSDSTQNISSRHVGFRCGARLVGCSGRIDQFHHRRLKGQGGTGDVANCLPCCNSCHALIHRWVDWAQRHGLIVKSYRQPDDVLVTASCPLGCETDHADQ